MRKEETDPFIHLDHGSETPEEKARRLLIEGQAYDIRLKEERGKIIKQDDDMEDYRPESHQEIKK